MQSGMQLEVVDGSAPNKFSVGAEQGYAVMATMKRVIEPEIEMNSNLSERIKMVYYRIPPGRAVLLLPGFLLLALLTALGFGLWLAALNAIYRDVRYVVPFLVQFWMFASPVAYSSSMVPGRWRWVYGLNPMAGVIEGFRWALTRQGLAPGSLFAASGCGVILVLLGGVFYFRRMEGTVADLV